MNPISAEESLASVDVKKQEDPVVIKVNLTPKKVELVESEDEAVDAQDILALTK